MTRREIIKSSAIATIGMAYPSYLTSLTKFDQMNDNNNFDVIIAGGSYAGLSAAMALGRSLRNVLIIDGGKPCNRQTPHAHNFITHDGEVPGEISQKAKTQVMAYKSVRFLNDFVLKAKKINQGFEIETTNNKTFFTKKVVLATGIKDIMPTIKGFSECWGISVVHCPYCHGYEIRDQKTAILANGPKAFHLASLVNNLTKELYILTSGTAELGEEERLKLQKHNIEIIETKVDSIIHQNGHIESVLFSDGSKQNFTALYGVVPFELNSTISKDLGCELTEHGLIKVDFMQKTTIDGVYACGDNSSPLRSNANAVYAGNVAGAIANMDLTHELF